MRRLTLTIVPDPPATCEVLVGAGLGKEIAGFLLRRPGRGMVGVVADASVAPLHGEPLVRALREAGISCHLFTFPAGESSKTRAMKEALEDQWLEAGLGRDSTIVALGGGVTLDLAGFTAATFMRGIPHIACPTTALAMIDAALGGKTAVDVPAGKNLIGAFHQPRAVFADTSWLVTLDEARLREGIAEAIKHGVIADAAYLEQLVAGVARILARDPETLEKVVAGSLAIKRRFVEQDVREAGARRALNFGHTFAHALERISGWSISHGEAVARGLIAEARLSEAAGLLPAQAIGRIQAALAAFGLPDQPFAGLPARLIPVPAGELQSAAFLAATRTDKKTLAGRVEFVLLEAIGSVARDPGRGMAWSWALEDATVIDVLFRAARGGA